MELKILDSIGQLGPAEWNALRGTESPFLRFEFLAALENNGCVGEAHGWLPRHLAAVDAGGRLLAAVPLYLKDNSYGEFVFDWAWADAYQRSGLRYYPKGVVAVPYTPVSGRRILVAEHADRGLLTQHLVRFAREWSRSQGLSSLHWLFTEPGDTRALEAAGLMLRLGCQFHWHNRGYRDFEDYLDEFSSRKRKKVRRERRHVSEQNIEVRVVHGSEASDAQLRLMHDFYRITFEKKWGYPTLTRGFFRELAATMGPQLVFFIAYRREEAVAGAICLRSRDTLYGRHWGCYADYNSLHFETCYYQGIEYCIAQGLRSFEPGAQGEHKISRGFMPTPTWSAHWIGHTGFRDGIRRYLRQETAAVRDYMAELATQSPFKEERAA